MLSPDKEAEAAQASCSTWQVSIPQMVREFPTPKALSDDSSQFSHIKLLKCNDF